MDNVSANEFRKLLRLLLAQRLELNAMETALKNASIVSDAQVREIRTQALNTAIAWSSKEDDDVLTLLAAHSSPLATMLVPPVKED